MGQEKNDLALRLLDPGDGVILGKMFRGLHASRGVYLWRERESLVLMDEELGFAVTTSPKTCMLLGLFCGARKRPCFTPVRSWTGVFFFIIRELNLFGGICLWRERAWF